MTQLLTLDGIAIITPDPLSLPPYFRDGLKESWFRKKGQLMGSGITLDSAEKPVNIICHRRKQTLRIAK
jgi:hypothetical protein